MIKANINSIRVRKNKKKKKKAVVKDIGGKNRDQTIPFNALTYDRQKDLPRLIAIWPSQIKDDTQTGTHKIIDKIQRALQVERRKAKSSHWSYNLTKHIGLLTALKAEQTNLLKK